MVISNFTFHQSSILKGATNCLIFSDQKPLFAIVIQVSLFVLEGVFMKISIVSDSFKIVILSCLSCFSLK